MAVITPNTDLYLIKVPLEIDDINQLTFANATAQFNYFNSLPKYNVGDAGTDFTYQRKDGTIRFPAQYDDVLQFNYVMYRNTSYSDKWFYAFIDGIEYLSDGATAISIKTDVWQTWQFDLNFKPVFVEREHVNDDTPGLHTVPENLEIGEYEIVDLRNSPMWETTMPSTDWLPCFCVTKFPSDTTNIGSNGEVQGSNGLIGGVFNSLHFFAAQTIAAARFIIDIYDNDPGVTSDAIKNIYMVPSCCVDRRQTNVTSVQGYALYGIKNYYESELYQLQEPSVLAGDYHPVNNKLLTYPFSYFYVTNKCGEDVTFHYEDFPIETINGNTARTITYKKGIVPSASLSAKLYFTNYKDYAESSSYGTKMYNYGINYGKVPVCAWTTDYYTNWLTQNGVNVGLSIASSVANMGIATLTTGGVGLATSAVSSAFSIANTLAEVHKAAVTPPQAHGDINTGDFNYAFVRNSISFYEMSIRPEMAQIIDSYFSMYGYRVNSVKLPNITGRRNWNYVKTIGCYIDADIPQDDLNEIKGLFDRGITFWHNPATFADYSQNNDII